MAYVKCKDIGKHQRKPKQLRTITADQLQMILNAAEDSQTWNTNWYRDRAMIFLGASIGMRRGEVVLFERKHFRDLLENDEIHVPTLKQSEKILFTCRQTLNDGTECGRKCRVKAVSSGHDHACSRCGKVSQVPKRKGIVSTGAVEVTIDIVEDNTKNFILDYIDQMRPDQRFLFESSPGYHVSIGHSNRIFNTHSIAAGVDPRISFHCLRHNRGVKLYSLFKDMVLCQKALRHKDINTTQIYADLDRERKDQYLVELNKRSIDPNKKRK